MQSTFSHYVRSTLVCDAALAALWLSSSSSRLLVYQVSLSSFWQVQVPNTKTQFQRFRAVKWVVQIRFVPIFSFNPLYNSKCFCSFVFFLSLRSRCLKYIDTYMYIIILCFRDSVRSFFSSRPKYAIRGTGILGQIASFERRRWGAAPTPLALPCPFRTST